MGKRSDTRYFGKVCEKHPELGGLRWQSGHCSLCLRERAAKWRLENPEKHREKNSRHSKSPRGRATHRKSVAKWDRANPASAQTRGATRRARKTSAAVPLTAADRARIQELYAEAIRLTRETGEPYHVHHDRPLARGGKHHPDNLLVVPASINWAIGDRYDRTWDFISS